MNDHENDYDLEHPDSYCDLSCTVTNNNGVVRYYDEEGVEVDIFTPDWGC